MARVFLLGLALVALAACDGSTPPAPPVSPAPSAPPVQPAPPVAAAIVPLAFQGEWNAVVADCGTDDNDSRLILGASEARFYEGGGPVIAAATSGARDVSLTVALSSEGEGPTDSLYHFQLSADGDTLTDTKAGFSRRRCPN